MPQRSLGSVAASAELVLDLIVVETLPALESLACGLNLVRQELFVFEIITHDIPFLGGTRIACMQWRTHPKGSTVNDEPVYRPSDDEREALRAALNEARAHPDSLRARQDVRNGLRSGRRPEGP